MLKTKCCWNMMKVLIQREVLSCPLCKSLSSHFGPIGEFRRFPLMWVSAFWAKLMSKAYEAIGSLAFHRANCTVANRSRSWTKTCAHASICTASWSRYVAHGVLDLLKVSSCIWGQFPFLSIVHWKKRNTQSTYDVLCLWRLHKRINVV